MLLPIPRRPRPSSWLWPIAVVVCTCLASPAHAQDSSRDFDTEELAQETRDHYERAMRAFKSRDYETAVDELRTVYSLRPAPTILYNIALAEWRTGDLDAAIAAALRAREEGLPERADAKNEGRIRGFRRIRRARRAGDDIASRSEPQPAPEPDPRVPEVDSSDGGLGLGWIGIGMGLAGAGALGGALYVDRRLARQVAPYERAAERGDVETFYRYRRNKLQEIRRLQTVGRVLFWGGVATTALGGTFVLLDLTSPGGAGQPRSGGTAVSVEPSPNGWVGRLSIDF